MKKTFLLIFLVLLVAQAYSQVSFDTVYIVKQTQPSYEELYDLLVSRKAEIEAKGGWNENDMQELAKIVSESKDVISQKYIDKKFKKLDISTYWIDQKDSTLTESYYHIEFGYGLTVFKKGGKMMAPTIKLFDKSKKLIFEGFSDELFKKLRKNKA